MYDGLPATPPHIVRQMRLCYQCTLGEVEDGMYSLLKCRTFQGISEQYSVFISLPMDRLGEALQVMDNKKLGQLYWELWQSRKEHGKSTHLYSMVKAINMVSILTNPMVLLWGPCIGCISLLPFEFT
eukprot:c6780_g1_i1 orf=426-806(+)